MATHKGIEHMAQIAALFLIAIVVDCVMAGTIDGATVALGGALALLLALSGRA